MQIHNHPSRPRPSSMLRTTSPPLHLSFLFRLYGRNHWYYSTIDLYRRIILSSVVLSLPTLETVFMLSFTVSAYCVLSYREVGPYWYVSLTGLLLAMQYPKRPLSHTNFISGMRRRTYSRTSVAGRWSFAPWPFS